MWLRNNLGEQHQYREMVSSLFTYQAYILIWENNISPPSLHVFRLRENILAILLPNIWSLMKNLKIYLQTRLMMRKTGKLFAWPTKETEGKIMTNATRIK